jgi:uncharacterized protein (TIGR02271 family)
MERYRRAIGLFYSRDEAESTVRDLKAADYDMDRVSVIAKDPTQIAGHETTGNIGNKADEGAVTGAITGGTLGGLAGLLIGLGTLAIPGIGPIILAGAEATAIATTLAGAGIGAAAGGLVGALIGLGIPEEKAKLYSDRVGRGSFLVMVTGNELEANRAASIMRQHGVEEFNIYDMPRDLPSMQATNLTNVDENVEEDMRSRTDVDVDDPPRAKTTAVADVDEDIRNRDDLSDRDKIRLYEERLMINKQRHKVGEVSIGKHVETETARVAVPVERERIVIERRAANDTPVNSGTADFTGAETVHLEAYEEKANIQKQAFVREEVNVHKEVEQNTVDARGTIRREELEIKTDGDVVKHK